MAIILQDADQRYQETRPRFRDEAIIRTACGCEKIVAIPLESHIHQSSLTLDPVPLNSDGPIDGRATTRFLIRRFVFEGQFDRDGRRVFHERVEHTEDWKSKYLDLYREVYGMDTGL
jgi:hypothetical protein